MSYLDWKIGDRVIFVGYPEKIGAFSGKKRLNRVPFLAIGEEYAILDMCIRKRFAKGRHKGPSIFVGCVDVEHGKVWHHHSGFRKIQTRKTDISIFTALLSPAMEEEPS
ncbi:hypothetical protein [Aquamicrobium terrae]|uniref:Uncharacterized protein n=1 Tax=Aquamicrobium terrae TaxID=1324945 RepID=A0ABV2MV71_9HYPH